MNNKILINEKNLNKIICETIKKNLNEIYGMSYKQMRNLLDIYDDDELNAAVACEDAEEMEELIANDICATEGVDSLYKNNIFDFDKIAELLEKKYGMKYIGPNDEEEAHTFKNENYTVKIIPINYYSALAKFRFRNFFVNGIY